MRNHAQLMELHRTLGDSRVLSVYLDGTERDPANRESWRVRLTQALDDIRDWLAGSPHAERVAFERCVAQLDTRLRTFAGGLRSPGWVAFITADGVHEATPLPVAMPTRAMWSTGIAMAPYVRALKEARAVVIMLVDASQARLYRYHFGRLSLVEAMHAHASVSEPSHMGDAPRPGFHLGTRGDTGSDQAQRSRQNATNRMLDEAARRAGVLAGADSWLVVGGAQGASRRAMSKLPAALLGRAQHVESFDIDSTDAEILERARAAASALRESSDMSRIREFAGGTPDGGPGVLGPADTRLALEQRRVRALYFTPRFLEAHPLEAEDAVRAAAGQGATSEEVSGGAAAELERHGGMAAWLRFQAASEAVPMAATDEAAPEPAPSHT